jgi:hypothetical protein
MWKAMLAGVFALVTVTMGSSLAGAQEFGAQSDPSVVNSRIAQFRSALHLTAEQARHWPRVEAVLRDVVRRGQREEASAGGFVERISEKASSVVNSATAIKRLVSAARPLVNSLDQEQKQVAMSLAYNMGFGNVVAQLQ